MPSAKGRIVRLFAGVALERATVEAVQGIGDFRRLQLRWEGKPFAAGAKVQLLLPSDDMRTYTPIPAPRGVTLLAWTHGNGPGTRWLTNVRANDAIRFMGPQRSLELDLGPVVLVGDETSVAVAAALSLARPGQVRAVIQSDATSEVSEAAASVGLQAVQVVPRGDTGATIDAVDASRSSLPSAVVAVTGGSQLVIAVRDALRHAGVPRIKTKTYWIPGKTGLD